MKNDEKERSKIEKWWKIEKQQRTTMKNRETTMKHMKKKTTMEKIWKDRKTTIKNDEK